MSTSSSGSSSGAVPGAPATGAVPVLPGISGLLDGRDGVILDLWGVVHDGHTPYPGAPETLARLMAAGKKVVMLSNAPRRSQAVIDGMTAMGIDRALYTDVLSSGEMAWRALHDRDDDWLRALGRDCLHIGPERDRGLFDGLELERIDEPRPGAFILNTGPWRDEETLDDFRDVLDRAAALAMPMICANPDLEVIRGGNRLICAGALAEHYAELGGDVRSYGKPHAAAYEACLRLMGLADMTRLLAIGDSFATDIKGANAAGIDAVLVTSGIHGDELGLAFGEMPDGARLAAVAAARGVRLAAAVPALHW
jgi:HAD superfamily hydrolase (TIGR01459 family)